jgi:hypothetical protein
MRAGFIRPAKPVANDFHGRVPPAGWEMAGSQRPGIANRGAAALIPHSSEPPSPPRVAAGADSRPRPARP